jgi:hypothetical protein
LAHKYCVNHFLAVHAIGEGPSGAHIAEEVRTIHSCLVAIIILARLDAEVDVLPGGANGEAGIDLARALQVEQQLGLI